MPSRILLLMPTTTYRVHDFMAAAGAIGIDVTIGSNRKQALEDYNPGRTLTLDFDDVQQSADRIVEFAWHYPLAAVLSLDDETTVLAARGAAALGLPHNPEAAARTVSNKFLLRDCLAKAGIPVPEFAKFSVTDPPESIGGRILYPCVLKPLALAGGRGVIRADTDAQFHQAFLRIGSLLRRPDIADRVAETADSILVERFVPGTEIAVEALLDRGAMRVLAMFDKPDPLDGPFFEETIYVTPTRLHSEDRRPINDCLRACVQAIGLREGPVHAEFRLNDDGVWPIDIAARSIGGLCSRSLRFGFGTSLEAVILRHALGQDVKRVGREHGASGVMMLPIPAAGILKETRGIDAALRVPGITDLHLSIHPGEEVIPLPEGNRYLGFLFGRGDTPAAVETSLREAHRKLEFVIVGEG